MPWSDQFLSARGIRSVCRKKILDEIFFPTTAENEWKILVVDEFAMRILSSCFRTEEVTAFNVALIEAVEKPREPVPYLSAVYFLHPSVQNVGFMLPDFVSASPKYLNAHLFFLSSVRDELFAELVKCARPGFVQTFKEIDFLFLPHESQVFSLNDDRFFPIYFDSYKELDVHYCASVAKKLATFCATLNVRPEIRYRRQFVKNFVLAEATREEIDRLRGISPSDLCSNPSQPRCELLILDRGFDCVSPIVHEFTLQAMAYDLLKIEDDVYMYEEENDSDGNENKRKEVSLTEDDAVWCQLRHEHIANVSKIIDDTFEADLLLRRHPKLSGLKKLPELGDAVRKHLAYRKNRPHAIYRRMANECMKKYCGGINVIAELERNLSPGSENSSKDAKSSVLNVLCSKNYGVREKLRVLLLYIFFSRGITKQDFDDIITIGELPFFEASAITNVLHLDVDLFRPGFCQPVDEDFVPKERNGSTPRSSKWVPALKSVLLNCVDSTLSREKYPYLDVSKNGRDTVASRRAGYWCSDKKEDHVSRLIVFVAGGITHSEMRSAYEVMTHYRGWEIYVGGDSFLTPEKFLEKLKELRCFVLKDM